jgi:hypothetical protein
MNILDFGSIFLLNFCHYSASCTFVLPLKCHTGSKCSHNTTSCVEQ